MTVLVTVHNEESQIAERLSNLLAQAYPRARLDILVASDGSTDATEKIVAGFAVDGRVRLFASSARLGKSETQNRAITLARGEIVVLTDAATRFDVNFVTAIVQPFANRHVGCVTGQLSLVERPGAIARGQGYYWRYEMNLRALESDLGVLAVASGQAMAFRRAWFSPIPPHAGDDCVIPLDMALAGHRVIHRPEAVAYDVMEHDLERELRSRIRMTTRNWSGTLLYPGLLNPWRAPGYALALWSHKILRWLGSVFLLAATAAAVDLAYVPLYRIPVLGLACIYALALAGWYSHRLGRGWALPEATFSFFFANLGFLMGLGRSLAGGRIVAYRSGRLGN